MIVMVQSVSTEGDSDIDAYVSEHYIRIQA